MPEYLTQPEMPGSASPHGFPEQLNISATPSLAFDADAFVHFLNDEDWTDDQKRTYALALWPVVIALLDWNFRFHPVQEALLEAKQLERAASKC